MLNLKIAENKSQIPNKFQISISKIDTKQIDKFWSLRFGI